LTVDWPVVIIVGVTCATVCAAALIGEAYLLAQFNGNKIE
jgi:hypothetical protein